MAVQTMFEVGKTGMFLSVKEDDFQFVLQGRSTSKKGSSTSTNAGNAMDPDRVRNVELQEGVANILKRRR